MQLAIYLAECSRVFSVCAETDSLMVTFLNKGKSVLTPIECRLMKILANIKYKYFQAAGRSARSDEKLSTPSHKFSTGILYFYHSFAILDDGLLPHTHTVACFSARFKPKCCEFISSFCTVSLARQLGFGSPFRSPEHSMMPFFVSSIICQT